MSKWQTVIWYLLFFVVGILGMEVFNEKIKLKHMKESRQVWEDSYRACKRERLINCREATDIEWELKFEPKYKEMISYHPDTRQITISLEATCEEYGYSKVEK